MAPKQHSAKDQLAACKWAEGLMEEKAARRTYAKEQFNSADKDNSNTLDVAEVIALVTKISDSMKLRLPAVDKLKALIDLCDKNQDGSLQLSEFQVFFKATLESAIKAAEQHKGVEVTKTVGGAKNGKTRTIALVKSKSFYPADDEEAAKSRACKKNASREISSGTIATLRQSITPGTVLILLAGRFRGRRVVFLKQLKSSGLLLVTGPYGVNGVPMRRVNQAYCIATSTTLDVSKVNAAKFGDEYFGNKTKKHKKRNTSGDAMFTEETEKTGPTAERMADQKTVDAALMGSINKNPIMAKYLKARFSLSKGNIPHKMSF